MNVISMEIKNNRYMANKNQANINLANRKALKTIGKPIDSKYGSPTNLRKRGPKVYGKNKLGSRNDHST